MEKNVLDHSTPIPLYFQLKSLILRDIQKGVYRFISGSRPPASDTATRCWKWP